VCHHFGFAVGVAGAPPPPPVVVAEPVVVPVDGGVYVVSEPAVQYDLFRYRATWYALSGGYWYQAPSYGGPFVAVGVRYVTRPVLMVPPRHWRNHPHRGPPGLARGHGGHED
jgi:hypothetical protein